MASKENRVCETVFDSKIVKKENVDFMDKIKNPIIHILNIKRKNKNEDSKAKNVAANSKFYVSLPYSEPSQICIYERHRYKAFKGRSLSTQGLLGQKLTPVTLSKSDDEILNKTCDSTFDYFEEDYLDDFREGKQAQELSKDIHSLHVTSQNCFAKFSKVQGQCIPQIRLSKDNFLNPSSHDTGRISLSSPSSTAQINVDAPAKNFLDKNFKRHSCTPKFNLKDFEDISCIPTADSNFANISCVSKVDSKFENTSCIPTVDSKFGKTLFIPKGDFCDTGFINVSCTSSRSSVSEKSQDRSYYSSVPSIPKRNQSDCYNGNNKSGRPFCSFSKYGSKIQPQGLVNEGSFNDHKSKSQILPKKISGLQKFVLRNTPGSAPLPLKFHKKFSAHENSASGPSSWFNGYFKNKQAVELLEKTEVKSSQNSSVSSLNDSMVVFLDTDSHRDLKSCSLSPSVIEKYRSVESIASGSVVSSMESLRSTVSDGNKSTLSNESAIGSYRSSLGSESSALGKPFLNLNQPHHTRSLIHSAKLQILSPISDKSQEPGFDISPRDILAQKTSPQEVNSFFNSDDLDNISKNNSLELEIAQKVSPQEIIESLSGKSRRNIQEDFRNVHHMPENVFNLSLDDSDSGISTAGTKNRSKISTFYSERLKNATTSEHPPNQKTCINKLALKSALQTDLSTDKKLNFNTTLNNEKKTKYLQKQKEHLVAFGSRKKSKDLQTDLGTEQEVDLYTPNNHKNGKNLDIFNVDKNNVSNNKNDVSFNVIHDELKNSFYSVKNLSYDNNVDKKSLLGISLKNPLQNNRQLESLQNDSQLESLQNNSQLESLQNNCQLESLQKDELNDKSELEALKDLPFDMPKLRRRLAAARASTFSSTPKSTLEFEKSLQGIQNDARLSLPTSLLLSHADKIALNRDLKKTQAVNSSSETSIALSNLSAKNSTIEIKDSFSESQISAPHILKRAGLRSENVESSESLIFERPGSRLLKKDSQESVLGPQISSTVLECPKNPRVLELSKAESCNTDFGKSPVQNTPNNSQGAIPRREKGSFTRKKQLALQLTCAAMTLTGEEVDVNVPLAQQSWYHGAITRQEAENVLRSHTEGSYLVRSIVGQDYSLSLKSACGFMHLRLIHNAETNRYKIGRCEDYFDSIPHIIAHFSICRIPIKGADHMVLLKPIYSETL